MPAVGMFRNPRNVVQVCGDVRIKSGKGRGRGVERGVGRDAVSEDNWA